MSHLLNQYASNRHLIMPAIGEGMAIRLLNRNQLVPIYLSATLVTQTLLGEANQGLLTLSEYAKFLRDMRLTTNLADLLGKLRAAQDATSEETEIWVKLEGLWEMGPRIF